MSTQRQCVDRVAIPVCESQETRSTALVEPLVFSRRVSFADEPSMGSTTDCIKTHFAAGGDWGPDD